MDETTNRTYPQHGAEPELYVPTGPKPPVKSRLWPRVRLALGLIVAVGLVYGVYLVLHSPRAPAPRSARSAQGAPQPVGVATIGKGDIRVIINALGTVTPLATVTVHTQINGPLTEVAFKEGQIVKKGDFLAQIDPRPYQYLQAQYEGQLLHDQGLLDQAKADLVRYSTLLKQDSIAKQQAENQIYVVQQAQGTVNNDKALIDQQKLNITYCHIVSPVDGRLGLRLVDAGNLVQTSDATGIVMITQLQPISVIFFTPEDNLPEIMAQLKNGVALQVTAYDRANVQQLAVGQVTTLDNEVDPTTGTVKLRALFDNSDDKLFPKLFPSQFVNVQLLIRTMKDVVTTPTAAVQRGAPGAYVYKINADSTVSVQSVTLGPTDGDMVAVNSGLSAGDQVVVDGADRLRDGARVTIPGKAGGASQAAPDGQGSNPADPQNPRGRRRAQ
ncbi:MAG: efflux RND transporter periplasmic adaptor subunit [Xanthobacteraceae bacterium]